MKSTVLTIMVFSVLSTSAYAWKLGEPLSKFIEDGAKDIERTAQNIGDAAADVVTLGEHGRRRDKARAEEARALALQEQLYVEQLKTQEVETVKMALSHSKSFLVWLQSQHQVHTVMLVYSVSGLEKVKVLVSQLEGQKISYEAFRELIAIQHDDMAHLFQQTIDPVTIQSENSEDKRIIDYIELLSSKVEIFSQQLKNLPQVENQLDSDEVVEVALSAQFEILKYLETNLNEIEQKIIRQEAKIETLELSLADIEK